MEVLWRNKSLALVEQKEMGSIPKEKILDQELTNLNQDYLVLNIIFVEDIHQQIEV
jgi:hypothetical protein